MTLELIFEARVRVRWAEADGCLRMSKQQEEDCVFLKHFRVSDFTST